jgi:predicted CopG family antitoxin
MSSTIEIDDDALKRLEKARRAEETYSAVIRRCVPPPRSVDEILKSLRSGPSEEVLDAAEESVARRRKRPRKPRN